MDWDKYFEMVEEINKPRNLLEDCKQVYRNNGYNYEIDFPDEYYFMFNTKTGEKVRLYYNGKVIEYK